MLISKILNRQSFQITSLIAFCLILTSCLRSDPNVDDNTGDNELKALEVEQPINKSEMEYDELIYVPIYSDIYIDATNQNSLLAATLSIRNTSYTDSIFISKIDYFNTDGDLVREYVTNQISLKPMATINYVIEREDETGGSGANFIVRISSKNSEIKPLVQAIMIGQHGNKGFAFATNGHSIQKR